MRQKHQIKFIQNKRFVTNKINEFQKEMYKSYIASLKITSLKYHMDFDVAC